MIGTNTFWAKSTNKWKQKEADDTLDRWIFIKRWQYYYEKGNMTGLITALLWLLFFLEKILTCLKVKWFVRVLHKFFIILNFHIILKIFCHLKFYLSEYVSEDVSKYKCKNYGLVSCEVDKKCCGICQFCKFCEIDGIFV